MAFPTKSLVALRNDAEAAADAIDEAQQQVNVLYESVRDARGDGHTIAELEEATGLGRQTLQKVINGVNPPIHPTINLP